MKRILLSVTAMMAGSLLVAYADPKDDVTSAAQKVETGSNYTWHITVTVPEGTRFRPGPTDGKMDGNLTHVKMSMGDNHTEFIISGTNAAVTDPDDGTWEKLSDMDTSGFPGRMMVGMIQNFKAPAGQASELAADTQSLQQSGNSYTGPLTDEGAKKLLSFGRGRRGGGTPPPVTNPSGTATFWVDNGQLTKFEYHVKGTMTFRDNTFPVDRDTTVTISDVGTTKVDVPADAKKFLP